MVDLLEVGTCSGQSWHGNPTASSYIVDSKTVASIFGLTDLTIRSVQHRDGITETPTFIPSSNQHFHGSGSIIIDTLELGQIAISAWARYDPNPKNTHPPSGSHINIDLYWCQNALGKQAKSGKIKDIYSYPVHAIASKKGMIKFTDLYNGGIVFSEHPLML